MHETAIMPGTREERPVGEVLTNAYGERYRFHDDDILVFRKAQNIMEELVPRSAWPPEMEG